jgi:hypothetical protein
MDRSRVVLARVYATVDRVRRQLQYLHACVCTESTSRWSKESDGQQATAAMIDHTPYIYIYIYSRQLYGVVFGDLCSQRGHPTLSLVLGRQQLIFVVRNAAPDAQWRD